MDDHKLPLDLTIYGGIHQHEMRKHKASGSPFVPSMIWQGVYSIKFKKVPGPLPSNEGKFGPLWLVSSSLMKHRFISRRDWLEESFSKSLSLLAPGGRPTCEDSSCPSNAPQAECPGERASDPGHREAHPCSIRFCQQQVDRQAHASARRAHGCCKVNSCPSLLLQWQIADFKPSSCLPDWALDLPQHFPFLFPFATRYNFLQSTSFGYARLILKWQSQQQSRGQDSSRRDDGSGFLGRLQRQKVRISRKHILESAVKVFELYGSSSSILEVEYFDEVGTGLGPTLEFYSLVSKEFARRDLKIWRDADPTMPGAHVHHPLGLFPAPISPDDIAKDGVQ